MQALRLTVARQLPRKHSALLMERAQFVPSSTQTVPAERGEQQKASSSRRDIKLMSTNETLNEVFPEKLIKVLLILKRTHHELMPELIVIEGLNFRRAQDFYLPHV